MTKKQQTLPNYRLSSQDNIVDIQFTGVWVTQNLAPMDDKFYQTGFSEKSQTVRVNFASDFFADTGGLWLLSRFLKKLCINTKDQLQLPESPYTKNIRDYMDFAETKMPEKHPWSITNILEATGRKCFILAKTLTDLLGFLGEVIITRLQLLKIGQQGVRWVSVYHHIEVVGVRALPIIGLTSFLIGAVLAYQGIHQLSRFGAQIYTIDFLGIAVLREIAVLITSVVVAGRTGSAYTAEIGTMKLNQEIDAIRMLGLNPIAVLVIPRMIALIISLPALVFFSMIMGMIGGIVLTHLVLDMAPILLWQQFHKAVSLTMFWVGMSKAPLFAVIIALVGCFRGFQVKNNAESVGKMTTQSVVESIFLVIICDGLMSLLFTAMGL